MLTTHVAVALSLLPGRTRFDVAARIRDRRPELLSAPSVAGPSLEHLVTEVAPELAAESALPQRLHVAADAALRRAARGGIAPVTLADPRPAAATGEASPDPTTASSAREGA